MRKQPVAYFSAEFAVSPKLPIYAGGLGVLAGDMLKESCDQEFPMVGVGLFYKEGYVSQRVDDQGNIVESSVVTLPEQVGLTQVTSASGKPIRIAIPISDHNVYATAWRFVHGSIPLYLLDTNVEENVPSDRSITNKLYDYDKETRFKQELVLGIGGIRLLESLSIHPSIYHLNEGHSAMLILDLVRHEMGKRQVGFAEAIELAKKHVVFTNHTLISGGYETFSNDLVSTLLTKYAEELSIAYQDIINLGLVADSSQFSMTLLALRIATKSNAVSRLHQKKAAEIWTSHPMDVVTNGIHVPTWDDAVESDIWSYHQKQKRELLDYIHKQTGVTFLENELLLCWARRIVPYKRPVAIFHDIERFKRLCENKERPVRLVISGFSPPGNVDGALLLKQIQHLAKGELKGYVVYLPHYDLGMARRLTRGSDVWLNTPVVGFEACGTSGMKAAINGVFPISTRDGWVDEAQLFRVGWLLDNQAISSSLYGLLEQEIVPMYFTNRKEWTAHMQNARQMILDQFSATRTLREYIQKMYLPTLSGTLH